MTRGEFQLDYTRQIAIINAIAKRYRFQSARQRKGIPRDIIEVSQTSGSAAYCQFKIKKKTNVIKNELTIHDQSLIFVKESHGR